MFARHGLHELLARDEGPEANRRRAANLRAALEELGPTFAKLGELLSTRPDLLPREYVTELAALQDRMTPVGEAEIAGR